LLRLGTVRQRHAWNTTCAAFTPDSKSIIVGDMGGRLVYWDVTTGKQVRSLRLPGEGVCSLALSADGALLAIGSWGKVHLWNPTTGAALAEWETAKDQVLRIAFAPDRKTIALGYYGKSIELWDVDTGKKRHTLEGHAGILNTFAFAPDGKTLASGGFQDPNVRIWDVVTGKQLRAFAVAGEVRAVTGPNGESRTSPGDVLSVAFSPDGKTLATCANRTPIRFWDPETGKRLRESEPPAGFGLTQLRYLDRKRLASIGAMDLQIWDAETGKMLRKSEVGQRFMGNLSVSPDGKLLATCWQSGSNTIDLWDADTVKPVHNFIGHRTRVVALAFAKGGQTLFSGSNMNAGNPIYEWDLASCKPTRELGKPPSGGASGLVLSPDRQSLFACGFDLHQFDVATGKEVRAFKGHTSAIESVSLSADGKTLASACFYDHTIRLWDPATGKERLKIELNQDWPCPAVLSPGGEVVVSGGFRDGKLRMWETASGKILREMATPHAPVYTIAFSPDGKMLAAAGQSRSVSLHDPATGKLLHEIPNLTSSWIARLAFSPDGRTLAIGGNDNEVSLWEVMSTKRRARFAGHGGPVYALAFTPDGRRLASGGDDTTILVWDLSGPAPTRPLSAKEANDLWTDLGGEDAAKAYRAIWTLAASPRQVLPFFEQQLKPIDVSTADVRNQFTQLTTDLDSDEFATRQKAGAQLAKLGPAVQPMVRQALKGDLSTEVRRQLEKLLRRLEEEEEAGWVRTVRVLEALEHMATPEARQFMRKLSSGAPAARLTQEARAALGRMK
jgi:WD40 repeat protein